jgi:hypothetical protein
MQKEHMTVFEQMTTVPQEVWLPLHELLLQSGLSIETWQPQDAAAIYDQVEHPNWAPWLEASRTTIEGRAKVFPKGQLMITDIGEDGQKVILATLSMNQIHWNGDVTQLPNWDTVVGVHTTDYSETYQPAGNTLVMMSMNVAPDAKGKQLPTKLIEYVKLLAQELGIEHVIGSFRPSGYGAAKLKHLNEHGESLPFWEYCTMQQELSGKPVDPWLRSLSWNGMQMLKEDNQAMVVTVPLAEFQHYQQSFKPELWQEVQPGVWECGEVGTWTVNEAAGTATYQESNVWGVVPTQPQEKEQT